MISKYQKKATIAKHQKNIKDYMLSYKLFGDDSTKKAIEKEKQAYKLFVNKYGTPTEIRVFKRTMEEISRKT